MSTDSTTQGWYYLKQGDGGQQQVGPISWDELWGLAQSGQLHPSDQVWHPSLPQWQAAAQVSGLAPQAQPAPSYVPPAYSPQQASPPSGYAGYTPSPSGYSPPVAAYAPPGSQGTRRRRSWVLPVVIAAVVVVVGGGLGAYFGFLRGNDDGVVVITTTTVSLTTTTASPITTSTGEPVTTSTVEPTTTSTSVTTTVTTDADHVGWTKLDVRSTVPSARSGHGMAYDYPQVILFGGWADQTTAYNDTWSLDPSANTWTNLNPTGDLPPARFNCCMTYDDDDSEVVLFGGQNTQGQFFNDLWTFDEFFNTWTKLTPTGDGPAPRAGAGWVYDSYKKRMILFGGYDNNQEYGDMWAYDVGVNTWTLLKPAGVTPSARTTAMIYETSTDSIILFGGYQQGGTSANDLWSFDVSDETWTHLSPGGQVPDARDGHSFVCDEESGRVFLFGGEDGSRRPLNDAWVYEPGKNLWTRLDSGGETPAPRFLSPAVFDESSGAAVLFGGLVGQTSSPLEDTWSCRF